jgi:hypothetical protein
MINQEKVESRQTFWPVTCVIVPYSGLLVEGVQLQKFIVTGPLREFLRVLCSFLEFLQTNKKRPASCELLDAVHVLL